VSSDDGGYVHDPEDFDEAGEREASAEQDAPEADGAPEERAAAESGVAQAPPPDPDREFDWRGWVLVVAIGICFLVIPAAIVYIPYTEGLTFVGLPYLHTLIALPMIPAVGLALLAVWATTRP